MVVFFLKCLSYYKIYIHIYSSVFDYGVNRIKMINTKSCDCRIKKNLTMYKKYQYMVIHLSQVT